MPTPDPSVLVSSDPGKGVIEAGQDILLSLLTVPALEDTSSAIQVSWSHWSHNDINFCEAKPVFIVFVKHHSVLSVCLCVDEETLGLLSFFCLIKLPACRTLYKLVP